MGSGQATAVYVVFGNDELYLDWIPSEVPIVVVHNDRSLDAESCSHPGLRHVFSPDNVGFGAGVNLALACVNTARVVLCNPDTRLLAEHWTALAEAAPDQVVSLPVIQPDGTPTSVVNRYPTAFSLVLAGWRAGRLFRRGGRARRALVRFLGRWGQAHNALLGEVSGAWALADYWASGAVVSLDTERLRAVGGFDQDYFLYFEDVDLCQRLDRRFPGMTLRLPAVPPAFHQVGGSAATTSGQRGSDRHHLASARRWGRAQQGWRWRAVDVALAPRSWWLERAR